VVTKLTLVLIVQVMRSRALSHLAKERDYALYLALWTANQHEAIEESTTGDQLTRPPASSLLLDSLRFSALISAPLYAARTALDSHNCAKCLQCVCSCCA